MKQMSNKNTLSIDFGYFFTFLWLCLINAESTNIETICIWDTCTKYVYIRGAYTKGTYFGGTYTKSTNIRNIYTRVFLVKDTYIKDVYINSMYVIKCLGIYLQLSQILELELVSID